MKYFDTSFLLINVSMFFTNLNSMSGLWGVFKWWWDDGEAMMRKKMFSFDENMDDKKNEDEEWWDEWWNYLFMDG